MSGPLRVAIVGCGLIGRKRAEALGPQDELVACTDVVPAAAEALAADHGGVAAPDLEALLATHPDVVIVAVTHDQLSPVSVRALQAGAHVLVEKPAGISVGDVDAIADAATAAARHVGVGFNHRHHPGIARAITEARSGRYGEVLHLRGRYGHGGRPGYDREWRADPAISGGGEMVDQGMHLLDLSHWLLGELPLHSALLRTQFWDAPVEDNAAILLGDGAGADRAAPWAMLHVSWTEWKNLFSLEIYCRTAKFHVEGLARSYGAQRLRIFKMKPEMGPPDLEEIEYPAEDPSWTAEWAAFRAAVERHTPATSADGLCSARYAWSTTEAAYASAGYAGGR